MSGEVRRVGSRRPARAGERERAEARKAWNGAPYITGETLANDPAVAAMRAWWTAAFRSEWSPDGKAGSLGAWGPLGRSGVLDNAKALSGEGSESEKTTLDRFLGPWSPRGALSALGGFGPTSAWGKALSKASGLDRLFGTGAPLTLWGDRGPLGALGPTGPLGGLGVSGHKLEAKGFVDENGEVVRTLDTPEGPRELNEQYSEEVARKTSPDASYLVRDARLREGETDAFEAKNTLDTPQQISVSVTGTRTHLSPAQFFGRQSAALNPWALPAFTGLGLRKNTDHFGLRVLDAVTGDALAEDMPDAGSPRDPFIAIEVPAGRAIKAEVVLTEAGKALPKDQAATYNLSVTPSYERMENSGPHQGHVTKPS